MSDMLRCVFVPVRMRSGEQHPGKMRPMLCTGSHGRGEGVSAGGWAMSWGG